MAPVSKYYYPTGPLKRSGCRHMGYMAPRWWGYLQTPSAYLISWWMLCFFYCRVDAGGLGWWPPVMKWEKFGLLIVRMSLTGSVGSQQLNNSAVSTLMATRYKPHRYKGKYSWEGWCCGLVIRVFTTCTEVPPSKQSMRGILQKPALFTQHGIGTRLISDQVVPHLSYIDAGASWSL